MIRNAAPFALTGMLALILHAALTGAVANTQALAQPPRDAAKGDPQSRIEPRSAPGAGQKYLEAFVGDWDVAKAFYPPAGEPRRSTGTCRQTLIHGGRFLQSDFVFGEGSTASTGTGIIGFEPETGHFTSIWVDSRQTRVSLRQSRQPFDGQAIRLESASAATAGSAPPKEARQSRTVSTVENGGRKLVHRQYAVEADGSTGRLVMELVLTRKPAPAAPAGTR